MRTALASRSAVSMERPASIQSAWVTRAVCFDQPVQEATLLGYFHEVNHRSWNAA